MNYEVGSYGWYMNVGRDKDFTRTEWRKFRMKMVRQRIEDFNLQVGEKVKIKVGGDKETWYTGTIKSVNYNVVDGSYIILQQDKMARDIDGWKIIEIVRL